MEWRSSDAKMLCNCQHLGTWLFKGTNVLVAGAGLGYLGCGNLLFSFFSALFSLSLSLGRRFDVTETLLKYC